MKYDIDIFLDRLHDFHPLQTVPEILLPIPRKALDLVRDSFNVKELDRYVIPLILGYSKKLVTNYKYIPFGAFLDWNSKDIRALEGRERGIFKNRIKPLLFDELSYREGNYSKAYRYKPEILEGEYVLINSGLTTARKIKHLKEEIGEISGEYKQSINFLKKLNFSECNLNNVSLLNDFRTTAKKWFNQSFKFIIQDDKLLLPRIRLKSKKELRFTQFSIKGTSYEGYKMLEEELIFQRKKYMLWKNSFKLHIHRDKVTFRLHHNLTGLPSECIKYLSIDNERIKEIDMNNCHYTLFSNTLLGYNTNFNILLNHSSTFKGASSGWSAPQLNTHHPTHPLPLPLYMLSHIENGNMKEINDAQKFINASCKGTLYETLGKILFGEDYNADKREEVKVILMEIFYGYYGSPLTETKKVFKTHFLTIYSIVNDLKAYMYSLFQSGKCNGMEFMRGCICSKEKKGKSDYKAGNSCLSILLMNMEAHLFVDTILRILQDMGYEVITKHDSVLAKESDYATVIEIVEKILNKELGLGRYRLK